jgi:hypothetical protein
VQGTPGATKYDGSIDAIRKILRADGVRGLYRGFGMSVLTYSPSSAVWWAAYGSSQRLIWRYLFHNPQTPLPSLLYPQTNKNPPHLKWYSFAWFMELKYRTGLRPAEFPPWLQIVRGLQSSLLSCGYFTVIRNHATSLSVVYAGILVMELVRRSSHQVRQKWC